jgi:hypothetical protein
MVFEGADHLETSFVPIGESHGSSSFPFGFEGKDRTSKCLKCVTSRLNYDSMRRRCIHEVARAKDRTDYDKLRNLYASDPKKLKDLEIKYGADLTQKLHNLTKEVSIFRDWSRGFRGLKPGAETECGKRSLRDLYTPESPWLTPKCTKRQCLRISRRAPSVCPDTWIWQA